MANAHHRSASFHDGFSDDNDDAPSSSPCCCLPSLRRDDSAQSHLLRRKREDEEGSVAEEESFVVRCAKKAREVSEVVAGPKWKNFVRSFSKKKRQEFRYDPESYALNFNDTAEDERPEFSGRYADPLGMSKR